MYEIREALEGTACRLAATRISDAEIAGLEQNLRQHATQPAVAAGQSYYQPGGDRDFHFGIAAASHNQRLLRLLSGDLYDVMRLYRFRSSLTPGRSLDALNEHRAILEALRSRDPAKAEETMRAHIRSSWENTQKTFKGAR